MITLDETFAVQRLQSRTQPAPSYAMRCAALDKLIQLTETHEAEICAAINQDFGNRCTTETLLGDMVVVHTALKGNRRNLKKWMKPKRVSTALVYLPGSSRIEPQPLGVVGVISPWNYPYLLTLVPAAQAIAAGNRVMIKPSELTPKTSALMEKMINDNFDADVMRVFTGDAEVGKAFSQLPFDHLFFTGSSTVGRLVAAAAAPNLTPVTLELGGKSPAIFGRGSNFKRLVPRLVFGKLLNAGQTCLAPDYVFVAKAEVAEFIDHFKRAAERSYPKDGAAEDYTSIINDHHFERLETTLEDAKAKGAQIIQMESVAKDRASRIFPPTLVTHLNGDMTLLQDEIFGPILPVMTYGSMDEVIEYINAHDRPLALYYFGDDKAEQHRVLNNTTSGGVTINDVLLHVVQENLPFGGVGASGMGAFHGEHGFKLFSHLKPIFTQSGLSPLFLLFPPYGKISDFILKFVKKII